MMIGLLTLAMTASIDSQLNYSVEADRLTKQIITRFYDKKEKIWKPPVSSSESVGTQGYTLWTSLLAWQAMIEGAKVKPQVWKPKLGEFYDVLEQYYGKEDHAYTAWLNFPGMDDYYYDDNVWAVIACMEAYEVTGESRYKARALDIFDNFVVRGWDNTDAPGGMRWGTKPGYEDRSDRTVSATAGAALANLLLAKVDRSAQRRAWSKRALDWINTKLSAESGLIYDGFKAPGFSRMPTIWTYNTGVPIRASVEYYRQTGNKTYLKWATKMGDASLDRSLSPMFDGAVTDHKNRYWYDSTFFVHYLVDGLRELGKVTKDDRYNKESQREALYIYKYIKDSDGLYFRSMRLWQIDEKRLNMFHQLTGDKTRQLSPDSSERSYEPSQMEKPVGERETVKTLLANAGTARMFWLLSH
jgi:predicted alpha-1,6-mannanase (GH76 family)